MRTVAALYVDPDGPYGLVEGVDLWPESRDARLYAGPHPVIAHPPCARWSVAAAPSGSRTGLDGGCFAAALAAVRAWGGVLEHPCGSMAWPWHGIRSPRLGEGWVSADWWGGWTCSVDQGHYGHWAPKRTWLYAVRCDLPSLAWYESLVAGRIQSAGSGSRRRSATPAPFRDLLLAMARSVE